MENENKFKHTGNLLAQTTDYKVISLNECKEILNSVKGKRKFKDVEVMIIRDFLIRMAEIEYLHSQTDNYTNNKITEP